ncbi:phosphatase PAP2 family protein [Streptomyces sp. NPDC004284]|uniref:phosphatase PAP2 family protein n=1 Tax=Streptomyces sp. NPDC004284 TaxID=3364695 RepID=UPI003697F179
MERPTETDPEPAALPPALRSWLGPVAVLAATAATVLGIRYAGHSRPGAVDARIWAAAQGVGQPWRFVADATDFLGEPAGSVLLVAATVTGCLLLRRPRAAVLVVVGTGVSVGATKLLKPLVGRTIHGGHFSYPSGHTAFLTAFALVTALLVTGRLGLGRTAGTALVLAVASAAGALMGWAQVALDAHYPTDVLGGLCTALAVVPAVAWLVDRTADRFADRSADTGRRQHR